MISPDSWQPTVFLKSRSSSSGHGALSANTVATNATHAGGIVDIDVHNMFGLMEEKITHLALQDLQPGKRPFIISRSTFPSSGKWTGHWVSTGHESPTTNTLTYGRKSSVITTRSRFICVIPGPGAVGTSLNKSPSQLEIPVPQYSGYITIPNFPDSIRWRGHLWIW